MYAHLVTEYLSIDLFFTSLHIYLVSPATNQELATKADYNSTKLEQQIPQLLNKFPSGRKVLRLEKTKNNVGHL